MILRHLLIIVCLCILLFPVKKAMAGGAEAISSEACDRISLDDALFMALRNNPDLKALYSRYAAITNVPAQRGSLPDPVLSFNALNLPVDTFDLDQEAMTQMQVRLTQKLPFPGKLSLGREAAEKDVEALKLRIREFSLGLSKDVEETWWDLFYIKKALWIIGRNKKNIQQMVDVARAKYEVGRGLQQDVLLAQVELTTLFNEEAEFRGRYEAKKARLFRLLGKKEASCSALVFDKSPPRLSPPPERKGLLKLALRSRPLLGVRKKEIEASRKRLALSKKGYMPDFTLGAAYGFRQDGPNGVKRPDFASFTLSMNIPIWAGSKQSRLVAQRSREVAEKMQLLRSAADEVRRQVESSLALYEASYQQAMLYKNSVIPQAQHTLASMMSGYEVNSVDFLNVIRARLALIRYEKGYWKSVSEAMKARARIAAATGTGFPLKGSKTKGKSSEGR